MDIKNKSHNNEHNTHLLRRISRISRGLLIASIIAIIVGIGTEGIGVINLITTLKSGDGRLEYAEYIIMMAEGLVLMIHYFFVAKFFATVIKEKTPFSREAAKEMRVIGWETIILPLVVELIGIFAFWGLKSIFEVISIEVIELVLGVFIIQTSYVIDYAAGKEQAAHEYHVICKIVEARYPEIYKECEAAADEEIEKSGE